MLNSGSEVSMAVRGYARGLPEIVRCATVAPRYATLHGWYVGSPVTVTVSGLEGVMVSVRSCTLVAKAKTDPPRPCPSLVTSVRKTTIASRVIPVRFPAAIGEGQSHPSSENSQDNNGGLNRSDRLIAGVTLLRATISGVHKVEGRHRVSGRMEQGRFMLLVATRKAISALQKDGRYKRSSTLKDLDCGSVHVSRVDDSALAFSREVGNRISSPTRVATAATRRLFVKGLPD